MDEGIEGTVVDENGDVWSRIISLGDMTPNANGVTYRIDGIDWGTNAATSVSVGRTTGTTTWDAGYVYAPYIPLLGSTESALGNQIRVTPQYFTFQPVHSAPYINLEYVSTGTGDWKVYVEPEDHFIEHEDLFEL